MFEYLLSTGSAAAALREPDPWMVAAQEMDAALAKALEADDLAWSGDLDPRFSDGPGHERF